MKNEIFKWQKTVAQLAASETVKKLTVVFLRKQKLWIVPIGDITAWARGTWSGIEGEVKIMPKNGTESFESDFGAFIAKENAAQFIGTCLMNGNAVELVLTEPGKAKARTFGMLREGKWRTITL